jgi:hypothetical protein
MTDHRRQITYQDRLEASLRWALESYVRPSLDVASVTRSRPGPTLQRERWRLEQADALLTEGGAWESTRRSGEAVEDIWLKQ